MCVCVWGGTIYKHFNISSQAIHLIYFILKDYLFCVCLNNTRLLSLEFLVSFWDKI